VPAVPAVFGVWAPILVELAQPRPGDRIVDVACGAGIVARIAAARVGPTGALVGVDLNPGMLSVARSVVSTDSLSGAPLQWQEASADKLPFPDGSFDIVYCQLGLQFFADRAAALREMRRVLGAEGRLALMVWRGITKVPVLPCWRKHWSDTSVKRRQLSCARHLGCPMPKFRAPHRWPVIAGRLTASPRRKPTPIGCQPRIADGYRISFARGRPTGRRYHDVFTAHR
jgi:SAM-dependent methyltransferase